METPVLSVVLTIGEMRQRAERSLKAALEQKTERPIEVIVVDTAPEHPHIRGGEAPNVVYLEYPDAPSFALSKDRYPPTVACIGIARKFIIER